MLHSSLWSEIYHIFSSHPAFSLNSNVSFTSKGTFHKSQHRFLWRVGLISDIAWIHHVICTEGRQKCAVRLLAIDVVDSQEFTRRHLTNHRCRQMTMETCQPIIDVDRRRWKAAADSGRKTPETRRTLSTDWRRS